MAKQMFGVLQVESTVAIQALQPRVKEIQEKYKGRDPQEAQVCLLFMAQQTQHSDCTGNLMLGIA